MFWEYCYIKTATFSPANKVEILRMHLDGISHEERGKIKGKKIA